LAAADASPILVIVGATGVGKTSTACRVAAALGGEIVSADSRQIYKGLDIGTAKPSAEELRAARHHMINVADPREFFDAGRYSEDARALFKSVAARDRVPVLVGGTGLYLRAALEGLFPGPKRDDALRERLRAEERMDPGCLHRRLRHVDPVKAEQLSPRDLIRVLRALEVYELTGVPLSKAQAEWSPEPVHHVAIGLTRPREELYRRIDSRVLEMVKLGLFEEVERLLASGLPPDAPGLKTIGYREIVSCLKGEISRSEAAGLIQRNTRRYAKRQMTWFRRMSIRRWISLEDPNEAAEEIVGLWRREFS
jgi:tRNA dimethylallyltransferase